MQISTRIVLGLAIMAALIVAASVYTYTSTDRLTTVVSRLLSQEFPALSKLDTLEALVTQIHGEETRTLSQDTPPDRRNFDNLRAKLQIAIGQIQPLPYISGSAEAAAALRLDAEKLLTTENQIIALQGAGNEFDARQLATEAVEMRLAVEARNMRLRNLYKSYIEERESSNMLLGASLRDISVRFAVVCILTALLIIVLGIRSILAPLRRLVRVTESIASGQKGIKAAEDPPDEFGRLGKSFNVMVQNLHQRIEEVGTANRTLRDNEKELQRQLRLAQQVQKRIIPRHMTMDGLEVFSHIVAARMIGGDFYDVQPLDRSGNHIGLVIGDASGNGIPAALVMVLCLTVLREASRQVYDPALILERVNQGIREQFPEELLDGYVTASYVAVDLERKRVRVANAGHEPPLLWRAADHQVVPLQAQGLFLGAFDGSTYESTEFPVEEGDMLLLFTDGLTETRNAEGEFYGTERLLKVYQEHGNLPCKELGDLILQDVTEFRGHPAPQDDVAVLLAQVRCGRGDKAHEP